MKTSYLAMAAFLTLMANPVYSLTPCRNKNFCVLSKMPLLDQSAYELTREISKQEKNTAITRDTGWCAPTAMTMALAAVKLENVEPRNILKFNSIVDDILTINNLTGYFPNSTSRYANFIYKAGNLAETNWVNGGTSTLKAGAALETLVKSISGQRSKIFHKEYSNVTLTNEKVAKLFLKAKPSIFVSMFQYLSSSNAQGVVTYAPAPIGHALAINGVDDGRVKIYDPWGRLYNVNFSLATENGIKGKTVVTHLNGDSGFVSSNTKSNAKIILNSYTYIHAFGLLKGVNPVAREKKPGIDACKSMVGGNLSTFKNSCYYSDDFKKHFNNTHCGNKTRRNFIGGLSVESNGIKIEFGDLVEMCQAFGLKFEGIL